MKTATALQTIETLVHYHLVHNAGCTDAEVTRDPVCILRSDGSLIINGEHPFCGLFCDYYGEFQNEEPYILPTLETLAEQHGFELEWETPGSVLVTGTEA